LLGYLLLCCELNLRHPLSLSLNNSNLTDAMNIIHHKQLLIISKINQNIGLVRLTFYSISEIYFRIPIQSLELWTLLLSLNFKPIIYDIVLKAELVHWFILLSLNFVIFMTCCCYMLWTLFPI
jgi:hypothetical protein